MVERASKINVLYLQLTIHAGLSKELSRKIKIYLAASIKVDICFLTKIYKLHFKRHKRLWENIEKKATQGHSSLKFRPV